MNNNYLESISNFFMALAKFFVKLAIFCVVVYAIGIRLFNFGHRLFYEKAIDPDNVKEVVFEIKQDDTVDEIANNLKQAGLIDDIFVFKFRAKIYKIKFTPNTYNLNTSMNIKNMLDIFDSPSVENIVSTERNNDIYQLSPEENEEMTDLNE